MTYDEMISSDTYIPTKQRQPACWPTCGGVWFPRHSVNSERSSPCSCEPTFRHPTLEASATASWARFWPDLRRGQRYNILLSRPRVVCLRYVCQCEHHICLFFVFPAATDIATEGIVVIYIELHCIGRDTQRHDELSDDSVRNTFSR